MKDADHKEDKQQADTKEKDDQGVNAKEEENKK